MPKLSKAETEYNNGKSKEKCNKDQEAAVIYRSQAKDLICQLAYLRLIIDKKASPFADRNCTDNERDEEISKLLAKIRENNLLSDITDKYKNHEEMGRFKKTLSSWKPQQTNDKAAQLLFQAAYEITKADNKIRGESLKKLLEATELHSKEALDEIINRRDEIKHIELNAQLLSYVIKIFTNNLPTILPLLIATALTALEIIKQNNLKKDDLLNSTVFYRPTQNMIDEFKEFNFDRINIMIVDLNKQLLRNPLDSESLCKALKSLSDHQQLNENDAEACAAYLAELKRNNLQQSRQHIAYISCKLGEYYHQTTPAKAASLFKDGIFTITHTNTEFNKFLDQYHAILTVLGDEEALIKLNDARKHFDNGASSYSDGEKAYQHWVATQDYQRLVNAVNHFKHAAICGHANAVEKLFDINIPEALHAQSVVLNTLSKEMIEKIGKSKFGLDKNKNPEIKSEELQRDAKDAYQNDIEEGKRSDIYRIVAEFRYRGELFEKNHAVARNLLEAAYQNNDKAAHYLYAYICLHGEGGQTDFKTAFTIASQFDNTNSSADELHIKGDVFYQRYLAAKDKNEDSSGFLQECTNAYLAATSKGHESALLSLFSIHRFDNENIATQALAKLYQDHHSDLPLLRKCSLPGYQGDKKNIHLALYYNLYKSTKNHDLRIAIPGLNDYIAEQEESRIFDESTATRIVNECEEILKANSPANDRLTRLINELETYANNGAINAKFTIAKYQLLICNNPLPLRHITDIRYRAESVRLLVNYYKNIQNGPLRLLTSICHEIHRHSLSDDTRTQHNEFQLLYDTLCQLDQRFINYKNKDLLKNLENEEQKAGTYFDEYPSDESDPETDDIYQGQDKHVTADHANTEELIKSIAPEAAKKLQELSKLTDIDDDKERNETAKIKSLFSNGLSASGMNSQKNNRIEEDLITVNFYSTRGNLNEGLRLVTTKFLVAQKRGLHFKTPLWNQPKRRHLRAMIKDKSHPLHNKPIYSAAVYDRAGITDFTDLTPTAQLRLEKIALHLRLSLLEFSEQDPYKNEDGANLPETAYSMQYANKGDQLQELYSNQYDKFHEYLGHEVTRNNPFIRSRQNPYVSTADLQSIHSERYAYGNKSYAGHEHERLSPKYDRSGRALRPHSGAVLLTLHPLDDYIGPGHNHVVSMNMDVKIRIKTVVAYERECTFFSYINKERLAFVHRAKHPSFHHQHYLNTFLYNYGLTQELYKGFQELILSTRPHEPKRRLVTLLLGEYLSAYQTLFLQRYAQGKAQKQGYTLLFRDKYGNFSLRPTSDIIPTPHGDDDSARLRRHYTSSKRKMMLFSNAADDGYDADNEELDANNKRRRAR